MRFFAKITSNSWLSFDFMPKYCIPLEVEKPRKILGRPNWQDPCFLGAGTDIAQCSSMSAEALVTNQCADECYARSVTNSVQGEPLPIDFNGTCTYKPEIPRCSCDCQTSVYRYIPQSQLITDQVAKLIRVLCNLGKLSGLDALLCIGWSNGSLIASQFYFFI